MEWYQGGESCQESCFYCMKGLDLGKMGGNNDND